MYGSSLKESTQDEDETRRKKKSFEGQRTREKLEECDDEHEAPQKAGQENAEETRKKTPTRKEEEKDEAKRR